MRQDGHDHGRQVIRFQPKVVLGHEYEFRLAQIGKTIVMTVQKNIHVLIATRHLLVQRNKRRITRRRNVNGTQ